MSYQAEERYWTDYLRIALPIVGLLLLLSVFWYWASSFIGDDGDEPDSPVAEVISTPITAPTPSPTQGQAVEITPESPDQTEVAAIEIGDPTETPESSDQTDVEPTATTEPDVPDDTGDTTGGTFAEGEIVLTNDSDVNLRFEPTTDSEVVDTLILGAELRILDPEPVDDGEFLWWNVEDILNETVGWVAEFLIDPVES